MQATLPTRAPFIYHRRFINDSMPDWIRHASSTDVQTLLRSQLKPHVNSNGVPHDWFTSGTPELQVSFLAAVSRQHKANRALAKALAGLKKSPSTPSRCSRRRSRASTQSLWM